MSTSLYYSAVRTTPLTDDEKAEVDRLIAVHNDEFPFDYEVLDLYPSDIPRHSAQRFDKDLERPDRGNSFARLLVQRSDRTPASGARRRLGRFTRRHPPADWDDSSGYSLPGLDDMQ